MIIDTHHPLSLETHIYDDKGKEHFFKWIDMDYRSFADKNRSYLLSGEEVIVKEGKWLGTQQWTYNDNCPYDVIVKGKKNPLKEELEEMLEIYLSHNNRQNK